MGTMMLALLAALFVAVTSFDCGTNTCFRKTISESSVRCIDAYSCYGAKFTCPTGVDRVSITCVSQSSCYGAILGDAVRLALYPEESCEFDVDCAEGYDCPTEAGAIPANVFEPRAGHKDVDVVTVPTQLVFGVAAVLLVLVTANVTCLFMQRQRQKQLDAGF